MFHGRTVVKMLVDCRKMLAKFSENKYDEYVLKDSGKGCRYDFKSDHSNQY